MQDSVQNLALGILPQFIGQQYLTEIFTNRETVHKQLADYMNKTTHLWGIHVEGFHLKDFKLPESSKQY
jgi:regulator of protease activity HflC (stomatin/prohibitin superfamily)